MTIRAQIIEEARNIDWPSQPGDRALAMSYFLRENRPNEPYRKGVEYTGSSLLSSTDGPVAELAQALSDTDVRYMLEQDAMSEFDPDQVSIGQAVGPAVARGIKRQYLGAEARERRMKAAKED